VVEDIMEFGNVQNGILGVVGTELNSKRSEELGIKDTEGFYVSKVQKESGAELSGIQKGDIIKSVDGIKISKFSDLKGFLNTKSPNDIVAVKLLRKNKIKDLKVKLEKLTTINVPIIGTLRELKSSELKKINQEYGLELQELSGYYKDEWISDGVNKGSIIIGINALKVNSIADVKKALNKNSDRVNRIEIIKNSGEKMVYRFR
jgi:S1-C subfamily serine protease